VLALRDECNNPCAVRSTELQDGRHGERDVDDLEWVIDVAFESARGAGTRIG